MNSIERRGRVTLMCVLMLNLGWTPFYQRTLSTPGAASARGAVAAPPSTEPDPCFGIRLPEPSDGLTQLLEEQQAISAAVFAAGDEDFTVCEEGFWSLDESPIVVEGDLGGPVAGSTFGAEFVEVFAYVRSDVALASHLTDEQLEWVTQHAYEASLIGGVVRSTTGWCGFFGLYQSAHDGTRTTHVVIPFAVTEAFDVLHEQRFGSTGESWYPSDAIAPCVEKAYINFDACVATAKVRLDQCTSDMLPDVIAGTVLGCLIGGSRGGLLGLPGLLAGCGLGALGGAIVGLTACANAFDADMRVCEIQLQADINACLAGQP